MTQSGSGYQFLMGSDIERDGMFMEMLDASGACVAEVFYSDVTGRMVVTLEQQELPIEAVEELLSRASLQLPPLQKPKPTTEPPPHRHEPRARWPKCTASRSLGPVVNSFARSMIYTLRT